MQPALRGGNKADSNNIRNLLDSCRNLLGQRSTYSWATLAGKPHLGVSWDQAAEQRG